MNKIQIHLDRLNISQTDLSKAIGKSYNMVNGYCNNRRQPSTETLFKIANYLGVRATELINDDYCSLSNIRSKLFDFSK